MTPSATKEEYYISTWIGGSTGKPWDLNLVIWSCSSYSCLNVFTFASTYQRIGGFDPIWINNRHVISVPFPKPEVEYDLLTCELWWVHVSSPTPFLSQQIKILCWLCIKFYSLWWLHIKLKVGVVWSSDSFYC